MVKMKSEPDKKLESKNGLDDANTNMSIYIAQRMKKEARALMCICLYRVHNV